MADETVATNPQAQYTEVLEVQVDSRSFLRGLKEIEAEWNRFVKGLNTSEAATKVAEVANTGKLTRDVADLTKTVREIVTNFSEINKAITETRSEMLQMLETGERAATRTRAASQSAVDAAADEARGITKLDKIRTQAEENRLALEKKGTIEHQRNAEAEREADLKLFQKREAAFGKGKQQEIDREAKGISTLHKIRSQAEENRLALEKKGTVEHQRNAEAERQADLKLFQQREVAFYKGKQQEIELGKTRFEEAEKQYRTMARLQEQAQREDSSRTRSILKSAGYGNANLTGAQSAQLNPLLANPNIDAIKAKMRELGVETDKTSGFFANFLKGIGGKGWAEGLGNVIRFTVLWQGVGLAIQAVSAIVEGVIQAFQRGFDYLTKFEQKVNDIKDILSDGLEPPKGNHTKWLDDLGAKAVIVTRQIEDLAAKMDVKPEILQAGYSAFVQNGGLRATGGNATQLVNLTAEIAMAEKLNGKKITEKRLTTEITNLMKDGNTAQTAAARSMNLTVDEANKLFQAGTKNHDLYERLNKPLGEARQRLADTTDEMVALKNENDQMLDRLLGTAAKPVWDVWKKGLQELGQFYKEHKETIDLIAENIGRMLASLLRFVGVMFKLPGMKQSLMILIGSWVLMAQAIMTVVDMLSIVLTAFSEVGKMAMDPKKLLNPKAWGDAVGEISKSVADAAKNARQTGMTDLAVLREMAGKPQGGQPQPDVHVDYDPKKPTSSDKERVLAAEQREFEQRLRNVKSFYDGLRQATAEGVSARTKSHKDAAVAITRYYEEEINEVRKLIVHYQTLAQVSGAKKEATAARVAALQKQLDELQAKATGDISAANRAALTEDIQIQRDHDKSRLAMQQEAAKQELAIQEHKYRQGFISEQDLLDRQEEAERKDHDLRMKILQEEADQYARGTREHEDAMNKMAQEEQRYTFTVQTKAQERIEARQREHQAELEHQQKMRDAMATGAENDLNYRKANSNKSQQMELDRQILLVRATNIQRALESARAELADAEAKGKNAEQTRRLKEEVLGLENAQRQNQNERLTQIASTAPNHDLNRSKAFDDMLSQAKQAAKEAMDAYTQALKDPSHHTAKEIEILAKAAQDAAAAVGDLEFAADQSAQQNSPGEKFRGAMGELFGEDNIQQWKDSTDTMGKLGAAAGMAADALTNIIGAIHAFKQGKEQGGTLGGIGAVMSMDGPIGDLMSAIPVVGPFIKPLGQIFSFVGQMFKAAAKKIADDIRKSISTILKDYQSGDATLIETIHKLEAKRQEAIQKLSGKKKGGKEQLAALLPEIDDQIKELKKQAAEIKKNFESSLLALQLHSDELANVLKQWTDINKQVKEYLGAGGDAAKAAQFLSLSLQKIRADAQGSLDDGEKDAIQDMLQMNDLLQQRIDLIDEFKKKEFDLMNGDAIERRQSNAIRNGRELNKLRTEFEKNLGDIDSQISFMTLKTQKEQEFFHLSTDIADLHRRDEELQLKALDEQILKWQGLQKIVSGIFLGANGLWQMSPELQRLLGLTSAPTAGGVGTGGGGGGVGGGGSGSGNGGQIGASASSYFAPGSVYPPSAVQPGTDFWGRFQDILSRATNFSHHVTSNSSSLTIGDVTIHAAPGANGAQVADDFLAEIDRRARYGLAPYGR
jgi:hypothetical protein